MPGDTKIQRAPGYPRGGWIDVDNPTVIYASRWKARAARRSGTSLPTQATSIPRPTFSQTQVTRHDTPQAIPAGTQVPTFSPRGVTQTPTFAGVPLSPLSGLQQRLVDRLTTRQGVSLPEALVVVNTHGYNAAASYGHMRAAGATHAEAVSVIDLDSPAVSLAYGQYRADGYDHDDALADALDDD